MLYEKGRVGIIIVICKGGMSFANLPKWKKKKIAVLSFDNTPRILSPEIHSEKVRVDEA